MKTRLGEWWVVLAVLVAVGAFWVVQEADAAQAQHTPVPSPELTPLEQLGKEVFFDTSLSTPKGAQGCVSCHEPTAGWTFPSSLVNLGQVVAPGAIDTRLGMVKTPMNAYTSFPATESATGELEYPFAFQPCNAGAPVSGRHCGGMFWDGRAEGYGALGTGPVGQANVSDTVTPEDLPDDVRDAYRVFLGPVADQALNPFPNTVEQNLQRKQVCKRIQKSDYASLYEEAFGEPINCKDKPKGDPAFDTSYKMVAVALAAWQASPDVNSYSSRRDIALRQELACLDPAGEYAEYFHDQVCDEDANLGEFPLWGLTEEENLGHDLFYGSESVLNPDLGDGPLDAGCWRCHTESPATDDGTEPEQLYTDYSYHNIGIPYNREIPGVEKGEVIGVADHLLTAFVFGSERDVEPGFFKSPSVRNNGQGDDEMVKAFGHNGYFKSLEAIVHFYNTRDTKLRCEDLGLVDATEAEALTAIDPATGVLAVNPETGDTGCWPEPEFPDTASTFGGVGELFLSAEQEAALVAYIRALSDTYIPTSP